MAKLQIMVIAMTIGMIVVGTLGCKSKTDAVKNMKVAPPPFEQHPKGSPPEMPAPSNTK